MYANVRVAQGRKNHVRDIADLGSLAFSSSKPIRSISQSPGTHGSIMESAKSGTDS
ncbi:MAG: hypothetical protein HFI70_16805 [Lachnospiraceae bacterium]|nr:hypothetical protein [Lachnospiraceae bacterium]